MYDGDGGDALRDLTSPDGFILLAPSSSHGS
jgi:hypothetical protein